MAKLNIDTPPTKGRLEHRDDPGQQLEFHFNPEQLNVRSTAAWVKHPIAGIFDPRLQYAGGEGQEIDFRLQLIHDPEGADIDIDEQIRWLESLVFPNIAGSSIAHREAPRLRLFFGDGRGAYGVVVDQVDVIQRLFYRDLRTRYAEIELKLIVDRVQARGWQDVRSTRGS